MEGTIGEIRIFAGNFPPRLWAYCQGQLLSIAQFQALFSVIGTYYGGDGRTTFGLPPLSGRAPVGTGTGPGLQPKVIGMYQGYEQIALSVNQMPMHTHQVNHTPLQISATVKPLAKTGRGGTATNDPTNAYPTKAPSGTNIYSDQQDAEMGMSPVQLNVTPGALSLDNTGLGQSHNNMQPWLAMNYIICLEGNYPSRN